MEGGRPARLELGSVQRMAGHWGTSGVLSYEDIQNQAFACLTCQGAPASSAVAAGDPTRGGVVSAVAWGRRCGWSWLIQLRTAAPLKTGVCSFRVFPGAFHLAGRSRAWGDTVLTPVCPSTGRRGAPNRWASPLVGLPILPQKGHRELTESDHCALKSGFIPSP